MRYSIVKAFTCAFVGPSPVYQALLEPAVLGHLSKETSFSELKHWSQQVVAGRLQRYDHGRLRNLELYGSHTPPAYDLRKADFGPWLVVSAGNDKLATKQSVDQYVKSMKRSPDVRVHIESYNHLDVWAALDNDVRVNLPILEFLERHHLESSN